MRLPKLYVKKSDKPVPRSYSALNDIFSSPRVTLSYLEFSCSLNVFDAELSEIIMEINDL
jgi:hypothetical protein